MVASSIRKGSRFRTLQSIPVHALTGWKAPFTGGAVGTLPQGESFTISLDPPPGASAVYCMPDRYEALHETFVELADRQSSSYTGYSLVISLQVIKSSCEKL